MREVENIYLQYGVKVQFKLIHIHKPHPKSAYVNLLYTLVTILADIKGQPYFIKIVLLESDCSF